MYQICKLHGLKNKNSDYILPSYSSLVIIENPILNVASRMEEAGMVGRINVSKATYSRIKDKRKEEPRGMIAVKGKGEMEMFFV